MNKPLKNVWVPTQAECDLIRNAASQESSPSLRPSLVALEPGRRYLLGGGGEVESMNILLVSQNPTDCTADTDLADFETWGEFRKGVVLTVGGRAVVDFYIRARNPQIDEKHGVSLYGNVTVTYAAGSIVEIAGTGNTRYPVK